MTPVDCGKLSIYMAIPRATTKKLYKEIYEETPQKINSLKNIAHKNNGILKF